MAYSHKPYPTGASRCQHVRAGNVRGIGASRGGGEPRIGSWCYGSRRLAQSMSHLFESSAVIDGGISTLHRLLLNMRRQMNGWGAALSSSSLFQRPATQLRLVDVCGCSDVISGDVI
ncbi:hypothetical protein MRX96_011735 [Rhipicephalus microplus]